MISATSLVFILVGVAGTVPIYYAFGVCKEFYSKVREIAANLSTIASFFQESGQEVVDFAKELDEILVGGNNINQASVEINKTMVEEVRNMRIAVERLQSAVFHVEPDQPQTQESIQDSYEYNYQALLSQGLEQEEAKQKASAIELERIYREGVGSSLGMGL